MMNRWCAISYLHGPIYLVTVKGRSLSFRSAGVAIIYILSTLLAILRIISCSHWKLVPFFLQSRKKNPNLLKVDRGICHEWQHMFQFKLNDDLFTVVTFDVRCFAPLDLSWMCQYKRISGTSETLHSYTTLLEKCFGMWIPSLQLFSDRVYILLYHLTVYCGEA